MVSPHVSPRPTPTCMSIDSNTSMWESGRGHLTGIAPLPPPTSRFSTARLERWVFNVKALLCHALVFLYKEAPVRNTFRRHTHCLPFRTGQSGRGCSLTGRKMPVVSSVFQRCVPYHTRDSWNPPAPPPQSSRSCTTTAQRSLGELEAGNDTDHVQATCRDRQKPQNLSTSCRAQ